MRGQADAYSLFALPPQFRPCYAIVRFRWGLPLTSDSIAQRARLRADHVPLGILFMLGATVMFALSSALSKWQVAEYSFIEVLFFQGHRLAGHLCRPHSAAHRPRRVTHDALARSSWPQRDPGHGAEPDHHCIRVDASRRRGRNQFLIAAVRNFFCRVMVEGKGWSGAHLRAHCGFSRRAAGSRTGRRQFSAGRNVRTRQCGIVWQRHRSGARHDDNGIPPKR